MSKYCGPRLRITRRLGKLLAFTQKVSNRSSRPGQHGANNVKMTQFAYRLREKQKLRFYYGISEKQLVRYVTSARKAKRSTGELLLQNLEIRLDNIIYRLGWASTLPEARQLVNHGHVLVNNQQVTIPSFSCQPLQTLAIANTENIKLLVEKNLQGRSTEVPVYLSIDRRSLTSIVNQKPTRADIGVELTELLVIEYYSNRL